MENATFAVEAEVEASHWWFRGRRWLFAREIDRLGLARDTAVSDIGTGTGAGLRMLREAGFTRVKGVDASDEAIRHCADKGLGTVEQGSICAIPFSDASQDLVLATDVIEHVDDDLLALREIARVLTPGGFALITVPTFPSLWGLQDEVAHHKRRYRMEQLLSRIDNAGLLPLRHYYFNYLLFVPIWLARRLIKLTGLKLKSENEVNSPLVNFLLTAVFRLDCLTAPLLHPPVGVSALVIVRRKPVQLRR